MKAELDRQLTALLNAQCDLEEFLSDHARCWGDDDNVQQYQLLISGVEKGQKLDFLLHDIMLKICRLGTAISKLPEDECNSIRA